MLVWSNGSGELVEELLHRVRIGIGHDKGEAVIRAGLHCGEDIGEGEAPVAKPWRTLAARPPDVADAAFLADAGFILEKQADTLVFMRTLNFF